MLMLLSPDGPRAKPGAANQSGGAGSRPCCIAYRLAEAGHAFYTPPGHTPAADADTEFVMFSPADLLEATEAAIMRAMQAMPGT